MPAKRAVTVGCKRIALTSTVATAVCVYVCVCVCSRMRVHACVRACVMCFVIYDNNILPRLIMIITKIIILYLI